MPIHAPRWLHIGPLGSDPFLGSLVPALTLSCSLIPGHQDQHQVWESRANRGARTKYRPSPNQVPARAWLIERARLRSRYFRCCWCSWQAELKPKMMIIMEHNTTSQTSGQIWEPVARRGRWIWTRARTHWHCELASSQIDRWTNKQTNKYTLPTNAIQPLDPFSLLICFVSLWCALNPNSHSHPLTR